MSVLKTGIAISEFQHGAKMGNLKNSFRVSEALFVLCLLFRSCIFVSAGSEQGADSPAQVQQRPGGDASQRQPGEGV